MKNGKAFATSWFSQRCKPSSGDGGSHLLTMRVSNPATCSDLISRSAAVGRRRSTPRSTPRPFVPCLNFESPSPHIKNGWEFTPGKTQKFLAIASARVLRDPDSWADDTLLPPTKKLQRSTLDHADGIAPFQRGGKLK